MLNNKIYYKISDYIKDMRIHVAESSPHMPTFP